MVALRDLLGTERVHLVKTSPVPGESPPRGGRSGPTTWNGAS